MPELYFSSSGELVGVAYLYSQTGRSMDVYRAGDPDTRQPEDEEDEGDDDFDEGFEDVDGDDLSVPNVQDALRMTVSSLVYLISKYQFSLNAYGLPARLRLLWAAMDCAMIHHDAFRCLDIPRQIDKSMYTLISHFCFKIGQ